MALAIDFMDGCGLSKKRVMNAAKEEKGDPVLAIHFIVVGESISNKMEHFCL